MDYPDSFTWRGLTFPRIEKEEDQAIVRYRSGNWLVWSELPNHYSRDDERQPPWWRARWQSTMFEAQLAPTGEARDYRQALEICLRRLRAHGRAHAVKMEDLQRNLAIMTQEKEALVKDLLDLILTETD